MLCNVLHIMLKLYIFCNPQFCFLFPSVSLHIQYKYWYLNRVLVKQPANILKTYRPLLFSTFSPERTLYLELRSLERNKP